MSKEEEGEWYCVEGARYSAHGQNVMTKDGSSCVRSGTRIRVVEKSANKVRIDLPIEGWIEIIEICFGDIRTRSGGRLRRLSAMDHPDKLLGYWVCEKDPWKVVAHLGDDLILYNYDKEGLICHEITKFAYKNPHHSFRQEMEFPIDVEIVYPETWSGKVLSENRIEWKIRNDFMEWENGEVWVKSADVKAFLTVEGHLMTDVTKHNDEALFYHEGFLTCAKLVLEKRDLLSSIFSDFSTATIDLIWSFTYFISYRGTFKSKYSSREDFKSWRFEINKCMTDADGFSSHIFLRLKKSSPSFGGVAALFGDSESEELEDEESLEVVEDPFNWGDENVGCIEDVVLAAYSRTSRIRLSWFSGKPKWNGTVYTYPHVNRLHLTDCIKVDISDLEGFLYGSCGRPGAV